jgi:hypothetical protein
VAVFLSADREDSSRHWGYGLDDSAPPWVLGGRAPAGTPWLMVRLDNDAFFRLKDGAGLTIQGSRDSTALIFVEEEGGDQNSPLRSFKIRGLTVGEGIIEARQGDTVHAMLQYSVFKPQVVKVAFFTVRDRGMRQRSDRPLSDAKAMIEFANKIYPPQTNIWFTSVGPYADNVDRELSNPLTDVEHLLPPGVCRFPIDGGWMTYGCDNSNRRFDPWRGPSWDWIQWKDIFKPAFSGYFNVFFVWPTTKPQRAGGTIFKPNDPTSFNCCYIKDRVPWGTMTFAHEAGHHLLGPTYHPKNEGHSNGPFDLMLGRDAENDQALPNNMRIPLFQAVRMQARLSGNSQFAELDSDG